MPPPPTLTYDLGEVLLDGEPLTAWTAARAVRLRHDTYEERRVSREDLFELLVDGITEIVRDRRPIGVPTPDSAVVRHAASVVVESMEMHDRVIGGRGVVDDRTPERVEPIMTMWERLLVDAT